MPIAFESLIVHVGDDLPLNYNRNMVKISTVSTHLSNIHPYPLYRKNSSRQISLWGILPPPGGGSLASNGSSTATSVLTNIRIVYGDERSTANLSTGRRILDTDLSGGFAPIPSYLELETTNITNLLYSEDKVLEPNGEIRNNPLTTSSSSSSSSTKKVSPITDIVLIEVPMGTDPKDDQVLFSLLPSSHYKLLPCTLSTEATIHFRLAVQYYDHLDNTVTVSPSSIPVDWRNQLKLRSYVDVRSKDGSWRLGKIVNMHSSEVTTDTSNSTVSGSIPSVTKSNFSGTKRFGTESKVTASTDTSTVNSSANTTPSDNATITEKIPTVRIHYVGWDTTNDEDLPLMSVRIAPGGYFTKGEPLLQNRSNPVEFSLDMEFEVHEIQQTLEKLLRNELSKDEERTFCTTALIDAVITFLGSKYENDVTIVDKSGNSLVKKPETFTADMIRDKVHEISKLILQVMIRYFSDVTVPVPPEMMTFLANYFLLNENCNYFYNHYGHITKDAAEAKDYSGVIAQFPPTGVVACKYFVGMVNCFYSHGGFEAIINRLTKQTERALQYTSSVTSTPSSSSTTVLSSTSSNASAAPIVSSNTNDGVAWTYASFVTEIDIFTRALAMGRWCYTIVWGEDRHFLFRDTIFNRLCSLTEEQMVNLSSSTLTELLRCMEDVTTQQLTRRNASDAQKRVILYGPQSRYTGSLEENSIFFQKFTIRYACRSIGMGIQSKDIYCCNTLQNRGLQLLTDRATSILNVSTPSAFITTPPLPTVSRTEFLQCVNDNHVLDYLLGGKASPLMNDKDAVSMNDLSHIAFLMDSSYIPSIDVLNKLATPSGLLTCIAGNGRKPDSPSSSSNSSKDEIDYFQIHHIDMVCSLHGRLFLETLQDTMEPMDNNNSIGTHSNVTGNNVTSNQRSAHTKRLEREERKQRLAAVSTILISIASYVPYIIHDRLYQYFASIPTALYDADLVQLLGTISQQNVKRYVRADKDTLAKLHTVRLQYAWIPDKDKGTSTRTTANPSSNTITGDIYELNINEKSNLSSSSSVTTTDVIDSNSNYFYHYGGYRLLWNLALGINFWYIRKDPLVDYFMQRILSSENATTTNLGLLPSHSFLTVPSRYRQRPVSTIVELAQLVLKEKTFISETDTSFSLTNPIVQNVQKQIMVKFLEDCGKGLEQNTVTVDALRTVTGIVFVGKKD